jgi:hypothetical protein
MMATRIAFIVIGIALVGWTTVTMLLPRMMNPPVANVLIKKDVYLNETTYETEFSLELFKDERINIKVNGNGKSFDLEFVRKEPYQALVYQREIGYFDAPKSIPADGTYILRVGTDVGDDVRVTVLVTTL